MTSWCGIAHAIHTIGSHLISYVLNLLNIQSMGTYKQTCLVDRSGHASGLALFGNKSSTASHRINGTVRLTTFSCHTTFNMFVLAYVASRSSEHGRGTMSLGIVWLVVSIDIEATAWNQQDLAIAATGNQRDVTMCTTWKIKERCVYWQLGTQRNVNPT